ncbi:MAG: hypothetical protein K2I64_00935 [Muribaculaceae bacterium]|nr:hypothetical protein [Muribaculaceae bacterium]
MNKIKSITLSIDEFSQILEISDPPLRKDVLAAVQKAAADPDSIDLTAYAESHPLTQSLVKKLKTRADAARRRAEKRKTARAVTKRKNLTVRANGMVIDMPLNDNNVRRLLWVKQHYTETIDNIMRILTAQSDNSLGQQLSACFSEVAGAVRAYLRPLIDVASDYFRTPKHLRPQTVRVPLPAGL